MDEKEKQPNNQGVNLKTLRTYTSDMADAVRENEISVIKIAVAEQQKNIAEAEYKKAQGSKLSKFFMFVGALALIAGGVVLAYFLINKKNEATAPTEIVNTKIESFISYDEDVFVDMTNATLSSDVTNLLKVESDKVGSPRSIKALFLTTSASGKPELLSVQKLMSLLKVTAPGPLSRSLADQYLVGTYTPIKADEGPKLFLIFETNDYNVAYAGMLQWEKSILNDLFDLFQVDISGERSELFERPFKDIIINNRDARILYDTNGTDVLYYIFLDKNKIIITSSQEAIKEIIIRLNTKNAKAL